MFFLKKLYQKVTPTQVSSCEYCESFKNNFFYRTPVVTASRYKSQYKKWISITKNKILTLEEIIYLSRYVTQLQLPHIFVCFVCICIFIKVENALTKKSCLHLFNLDPLYLGLMTRIDFCVFCARWPNLLS